jgi:Fe-S-cluster containining protein
MIRAQIYFHFLLLHTRRAKLFPTMKDLKIKCGGCAACCQEVIPPITHLDARRIIDNQGLSPEEFARMYTSDEIDLDDASHNWVNMNAGKRVFALLQPAGKCRFLSKHNKCTIYDFRPMVCRGYPYSVELDKKNKIKSIDSHKSTQNNSASCEAVAHPVKRGHIIKDSIQEDREDKAFWKKCKEWNKGKRERTYVEFLDFMGLLD